MATCVCEGGVCKCETIQVPPKLSFWKKHDRHVHGFVAWMAILNVAMLGALPIAMYAQEPMNHPPSGFSNAPCVILENASSTDPSQAPCIPFRNEESRDRDMRDSLRRQDPRQREYSGTPNGDEEERACNAAETKKQIAAGIKYFARVKTRIAQLEKKSVKIPQEVTDALAQVDALSQAMQAAATCEALVELELGDSMREIGEVVQEALPNLERLANSAKIFARIERQFKTLDRQLASDKVLAAKSKLDLSSAVKNFEDELGALKQAFAEAKAMLDAGEAEDGFEKLEQDVFENIGNVAQAHTAVRQLLRMQTTIATVTREMANEQRALDRLKKAGKDTAEAQGYLDEGKALLEELKAAAGAQSFDASTVTDVFDRMADAKDAFTEAYDVLRGVQSKSGLDQGLNIPPLQAPSFNF